MKKSLKVIQRTNPLYTRCPSCKEPNSLHRSRSRNAVEETVKTISFFKTYRCSNCGWRGYISKYRITRLSVMNFFIYLALALFSGLFVLQILKRGW